MLRSYATVLLAFAVGLTACGGDDDDTDTERARALPEASAPVTRAITLDLRRALTTNDQREGCQTLVTEAYVRRVDGTLGACRQRIKRTASTPDAAQRISVIDAQADDRRAVVHATVASNTRATGPVTVTGRVLMQRLGNRWAIDEYDADFLRSTLRRTATALLREAPEGRLLSRAEVRDCILGNAVDLPDARVRELAYPVVGGNVAAITRFGREALTPRVAAECIVASAPAKAAFRKRCRSAPQLAEEVRRLLRGLDEQGFARDCA